MSGWALPLIGEGALIQAAIIGIYQARRKKVGRLGVPPEQMDLRGEARSGGACSRDPQARDPRRIEGTRPR